jgi:hypothetical protein
MKRIIVAAVALLCGVDSVYGQTRVRGRVLAGESGAPLAGATIQSSGARTLTDGNGRFALTLDSLPAIVIALHLGMQTDSQTVLRDEPMLFRLQPAPLSIQPLLIATERTYSTASSSVIRELDIRLRPRDSSQRLLALTPGLVIAQHAGGGKAEQIFMRGFDADHGTDVAITVDDVPVNLVSHAHGQGYADLHFLLPELVARVETRKGMYDPRDGDFATAGAVSFNTVDRISEASITTRIGGFGHREVVSLLPAGNGYVAGGWLTNDGPFTAPQQHQRTNLFAKHTAAFGDAELILSATAFDASWSASGQIPQRAVRTGIIGRFGSIDPTEGGATARYSLSAALRSAAGAPSRWDAGAYLVRYQFKLFSNFTFFLNDTINGDGIEQRDQRLMLGGHARVQAGLASAGIAVRTDLMDVALYQQANRERFGIVAEDGIRQTHLSGWLEQEMQTSRSIRIAVGVRADGFHFDTRDQVASAAGNAFHRQQWIGVISPRFRLASSVGELTSVFASGGWGFHSNDARDVARAAQNERVLPRATGAELGARHTRESFTVGVAGWLTDLQSELVYIGDEGTTEASGATRRIGVDMEARLRILPWLWADADLNLSRGRYRHAAPGEDMIPLAPSLTSTGGLRARGESPLSGAVRYRLIGARAANESNEVRARQSHLWELSAAWERGPLRVSLGLDNLFDVDWNEAQFATTSRLRSEVKPVTELHFTPGAPRTLTLGGEIRF